MAKSGWSERPSAISLRSSPSLQFNNLSALGNSIAFVRQSDVLVVDSSDKSGKSFQRISTRETAVMQAKLVRISGQAIVVIASVSALSLWEIDGSRELWSFTTDEAGIDSDELAAGFFRGICQTGPSLYVGASSGDLFAFKREGAEEYDVYARKCLHDAAVVDASSDGDHVVSCDESGTVIVWEPSLSRVCSFDGSGVPATSVVKQGDVVAAAFADGSIRIFRSSLRLLTMEIAAHARTITALALHEHGERLVSVGEDAVMQVWKLPNFESKGSATTDLLHSSVVADHLFTGVAFVDDALMATAYDRPVLSVWRE
eukprot:PLAT14987.1.p1 GENE.PLAT14987.1~~PLAT14987.1.p1  ORF type:complete len:315 (+),score=129.02 PLAT14987.1:56-1000(+)